MKEFNAARLNADVVKELIESKKYAELKELCLFSEPRDIAALFEAIGKKLQSTFFRLLPKELAAECFVMLGTDVQRSLIESFTEKELSALTGELFLDDAVDIIEEMPANVVKKILKSVAPEDRAVINQILGYPKDSAGSLMTPEYVRLFPDMTADEALLHIRRVALDSETVYTCYVTDKRRKLLGIVTAKQLLISPPETLVSDMMNTSPIYVNTATGREEVIRLIREYSFLALPVTDNEDRLVGIVTVDDAVDVMSEETEEDFAKMAAITPSDGEYLKTSAPKIWLSRIPWLLLLLITSTFSGAMLSGFEAVLPAILVLFVPMLMGTGGNCASQASVTVIRSISLGTVSGKSTPLVILKELSVGILCGITLGAVAFLKVYFLDSLITGADISLNIAFAVSAALVITVIVAKLVGALLPIGVKAVGLDPAVMASPFITTLVDVISLAVYFFIARAIIL